MSALETYVPEVWARVRSAPARDKARPLAEAIHVEICARVCRAADERGYAVLDYHEVARLADVSESLANRVLARACPGRAVGGVCVAKCEDC